MNRQGIACSGVHWVRTSLPQHLCTCFLRISNLYLHSQSRNCCAEPHSTCPLMSAQKAQDEKYGLLNTLCIYGGFPVGSPRYSRRPKGDNDAGQGANVDDDWFLTKEDAVGAEQQASGSGAHRTRKEAQEMQIDMESMEVRQWCAGSWVGVGLACRLATCMLICACRSQPALKYDYACCASSLDWDAFDAHRRSAPGCWQVWHGLVRLTWARGVAPRNTKRNTSAEY